jgi:predicted oxidoreductase
MTGWYDVRPATALPCLAALPAQLDRFVEAGGTLVDTADVYGDGRAEETAPGCRRVI